MNTQHEFPTFSTGERVELHPATDLWMRGARFGTVLSGGASLKVRVQLDRLAKPVRVHPRNLLVLQ